MVGCKVCKKFKNKNAFSRRCQLFLLCECERGVKYFLSPYFVFGLGVSCRVVKIVNEQNINIVGNLRVA